MKALLRTALLTFGILILGFAGYVLWHNRALPADEFDLAILARTQELLSDESRWARDDDRKCDDDGAPLSLYCALRQASVEVTGEFRHRAAALQAVRHAIDAARPDRDYAHRLMDFNNDPDVSFRELQAVLDAARGELESGHQ
jgi:hypothetical protein